MHRFFRLILQKNTAANPRRGLALLRQNYAGFSTHTMLKDWKPVSSRTAGDFRIFKIRSDEKISPRTGRHCDFFVIESVEWVNVIAVTPRDELVMVEQYRHGSNTVELEIPGGMMDSHESDPVATGVRELREETGYEGTSARALGWIYANPAIMNNRSHFVVVEQCELRHECEFDHSEDLVTRLVPWKDIPGLVSAGKICHPLVVCALYRYELSRRTKAENNL
jgi:ADP-ribose pyrophosphatase